MANKEDLIRLTESIHNEDAERELWKAIRAEGLLTSEATLGAKLSTALKAAPTTKFDEPVVRRVLDRASSGLEQVYRNANSRVWIAFSASLVCAAATVTLGLWAVWYLISAGGKVNQLKAVSSFLTAVLSGSCFWLYRKERERLNEIEKEMMKFREIEKELIKSR